MLFAALFAALEMISVTNHAGRVLEVYPIALTNRVAILERANGERVRIPLRAFPETEQQRLCAALGAESEPTLSTKQKRQQQFYQDLLKRNEALHKAGATDDATYEQRREQLERLLKN